jgi:hypothetical protein
MGVSMNARLLVMAASALCVAGIGRAEREITEVARSLDDLPQSVAATIHGQSDGRHAGEIEEIRYEGVPVLYEVEFEVNGREQEIVVRPNGELVRPRRQEAGDGSGDDELRERPVAISDLPWAAAEALRAALNGREAEEIEAISFQGIVVLYEAELEGDAGQHATGDEDDGERDQAEELYLYPYGAIATRTGDVIERDVVAADLPKAVAETLHVLRAGGPADEIEEIRYEGVPILYEAEFGRDAQAHEVSVFPDGRLAGHDDRDAEAEEGIEERELDVRDLPRAVAEALRRHAEGGEIEEVEEIRYEGLVVLYEAEIERDGDEEYDLYVYPGGRLAESRRCGGGEDDDGDGDDDDDGGGEDDDGDDDDDDGDDDDDD